MDIVNQVLDFMRAGFDQVNAVQGLIIAALAALIMPAWKRLPIFVGGATLVHIIADTLVPVIANRADLRLPDVLEAYFWEDVAFLLIGYLIIISLLFFIRQLLLRR